MMRTWTLRGLTALLTLTVAVPMLRAAPPSESQSTEDRLTQVLDQLRDVRAKLTEIKDNQLVQIKSMQGDIDRLKEEVRRLSDEVHRLSTTTQTNIAASINPNPLAPRPAAGTVVLTNNYGYPVTVFINGQSFRVDPASQVRVAGTPVGPFTYSVVTDNGYVAKQPTERVLTAGRDFPITINP